MDPYAYVGNNPETRTDPTGHSWWDDMMKWLKNFALPEQTPAQRQAAAQRAAQIQALKDLFDGKTDTIDPANLQNLDMEQIRQAVPPGASVRVMTKGLTGIVYQWKRADGTVMQVEAYGPTNSGRGFKTDTQSTLHISELKTDASGNLVPDPVTGFPERTRELNESGIWESSALANPRSPNFQESVLQSVHITMQPVTAENVAATVQEVGPARLTEDPMAYGTEAGGNSMEGGGGLPPTDGLPGEEEEDL